MNSPCAALTLVAKMHESFHGRGSRKSTEATVTFPGEDTRWPYPWTRLAESDSQALLALAVRMSAPSS